WIATASWHVTPLSLTLGLRPLLVPLAAPARSNARGCRKPAGCGDRYRKTGPVHALIEGLHGLRYNGIPSSPGWSKEISYNDSQEADFRRGLSQVLPLFIGDPSDLYRFAPQRQIGCDHGGKFLRAIPERVDAKAGQPLDQFRVAHGTRDFLGDSIDHVGGRPGPPPQPVPGERLEARVAGLAHRRNVWKRGHAMFARYRQQPDSAAGGMRHHVGQESEIDRDVAA